MDAKKKEHSLTDKIKEGVSVEELETLARKYTIEVFVIIAIIIAAISSGFSFFMAPWWSLFFAGIGAVVSIAFPEKIIKLEKNIFKLTNKPEKSAQIAIGIVRLVVALLLPFIIFAELGLLSGTAFHYFSKQLHVGETKEAEKKTSSSESDEEHV